FSRSIDPLESMAREMLRTRPATAAAEGVRSTATYTEVPEFGFRAARLTVHFIARGDRFAGCFWVSMSCFILPPESQAMRGLLSYLLRLRSQQSTFTRPCPCLLRKNAFHLTRAGFAWQSRNPIPQKSRTSASSAALLNERPEMLITDVPKWTMTAALPSQPRIMRAADQ